MSNSNIPSLPVDNAALINAIVNQINANTNTKATETQEAIVADGDITQEKLNDLTTVNGDISTEVQAINQHVTDENNRVLENIPSSSIKSIQRGEFSLTSSWDEIPVSLVDISKTTLNIVSWGSTESNAGSYLTGELAPMAYLKDETTIYVSRFTDTGTTRMKWELIEYV